MIAHLDGCPSCRTTLEELAGADPTLLSAAATLCRNDFAAEGPLRRVLEQLAVDPHRTTVLSPTTDRSEWWRSILRPSDSSESLGRVGDYEVTGVLGQGGMGLVFRAFDPGLKRSVAIKVLSPNLAGDREARLRFAREARAAAAVRHEYVVTIHGISEANGLPYFLMEYLEGGSLQDYLERHGPPDWRLAARIGMQVASGLAAAHVHGLIHRDIKPSNILMQTGEKGDPGTPKISDFGLARVADEARLTHTGVVAGTPMFMAPEQALGEALDHRADLFSLGSLLYALCTGRDPFPGASAVAVLRKVCEASPTPLRNLNPEVPPWLAAVIERLQAKRPADRFATAAEVAELLRHNLAHPDQLRPVPGVGAAALQRRRRTLVLLVGVVAAFAVPVGLMLGNRPFWRNRTNAEAPPTQTSPIATLEGHNGLIMSLAYAPDGRTLATGSDDTTIRLWDASTGQESLPRLLGHGGSVSAVAFAHSGKFLASGSEDGTIRIWDAVTRQERPPLPPRNGNARRLTVSADDKTLAVASTLEAVELWDVEERPGHQNNLQALVFSPDGTTLAAGDTRGRIRIWDMAGGETEVKTITGDRLRVGALAFSPDSQILASAGTGEKTVKLWNLAHREIVATFPIQRGELLSLAFSPKGTLLAAAGRDGSVTIWSVPDGRVMDVIAAHQGAVWTVAFSPDGQSLASAGEDRLGRIWDVSRFAKSTP